MSQNNGVVVFQERVPARMSYAELETRIRNVKLLNEKLPFYVGDLIIACDGMGEKGSQLINEFGYSLGHVNNLRSIGKKFPPGDKARGLPWSFCQAMGKLTKREREPLIMRALDGKLSREELRALTAEPNEREEIPPLIAALLLAGKLLSREAKGEDVAELLSPALDELIAVAIQKKAKIDGRLKSEV